MPSLSKECVPVFTSTTFPVEVVGIMESPLPVTSVRFVGAAGILSTNAGGLTSTQPCGSNLTCLRFHVRHPYRIYSFGRHGITGGCYRDRGSRRIISEKHFPFSVVQPVDRNSKICEWLALLIWDALVTLIPGSSFPTIRVWLGKPHDFQQPLHAAIAALSRC